MSLLAITFAFSLATLGTAVAVSVRAYLNAALGQERAIIDRISLESSIAKTQDQLASGQSHPMVPTTLEPITINGRAIKIEISVPEQKWDFLMDPAATLQTQLVSKGLPPLKHATQPSSLAHFASESGYTAGQEDCLRREFTFGRAPAARLAESVPPSDEALSRTMSAGDQIDIRASLASAGVQEVLWTRLRLIGASGRWGVHDYRRLRVPMAPCQTTKESLP